MLLLLLLYQPLSYYSRREKRRRERELKDKQMSRMEKQISKTDGR